MKQYLILINILILITSCTREKHEIIKPIEIPELEHLAIDVAPGQSRTFVYTNKAAAFFYGETGKIRQEGHQGFYVMMQRFLDDYLLSVDGRPLERIDADTIRVYPDHLTRTYRDEIWEDLFLLDHLNCLVIELSSPDLHSFDFTPLLPVSLELDQFESHWHRNEDLLVISPRNSGESTKNQPTIGFQFDGTAQFNPQAKALPDTLLPANLVGQFRIVKDNCRIFFLAADNEEELKQLADHVMNNVVRLVDEKRKRLVKLLGDCHFETNLPDLNKAFRWAVIAMDQLIMRQPGGGKDVVGIFAGLPWFNNYWGRDTFISFPGAVLVRGEYETAKDILLSFAQFQNENSNDSNYGRIPNQVTTDNIIYNTADGTPWFVRELWEYYQYSGDRSILETLYPVVRRAVDGTLKFHTDKYQFLTHQDAETWMDAQGTEGPWSPRGNRAVEIQALWYEQLLASSKIAQVLGKKADVARWQQIANELKGNFQNKFWDNGRLALFDHLNLDDSPDPKIRPNQIFAVTVPASPLLSPEHEFTIMKEVATLLTYSYGVASLWQNDPDFHPFHILPKYYPKDEAYHNGTVWGWLAGPVITSLMKYNYQNLAHDLLMSESNQILNRGAVGTLSELLDAIPSPGKEIPVPSGTVSQAWSLAEFIRNIFQDLIGIRPDVPNRKIVISPHLPDNITSLTCCVPVPNSELHLSMQQDDMKLEIILNYLEDAQPWNIEINYLKSPTEKIIFDYAIKPGETRAVRIEFEPTTVSINGKQIGYRLERIPIRNELLSYFSFAVPQLDKNLNYLKPPPYPLLSGEQIKTRNKKAEKLIDVDAAKNDDKGPNKKYVYPTSPYFKDGILDLTRFQLLADNTNYYFRLNFRELAQPNWHPEYGFQLTFAGIAIDQGTNQPGAKFIQRNANLQLPRDFVYHRIILVGGGLQIEDAGDNILAAFRPEDVRYPLGDVQEKEISFAIPKSFLGNYDKNWRFIIAVGAQDDHGGGGIGEFRNVGKIASQWQGGGAERESGNCNVYDLFVVK